MAGVNVKWGGIVVLASIGLAQSPTAPKFEVTSVRLNTSPDPSRALMQFLAGGRFVSSNLPLSRVIAVAWGLSMQTQRLTVAPGVRMPEEVYDIQGTAENGTFPSGMATEARVATMKLMLQALLEDRFKLSIRRESREEPIYAVVVAKDGPKIEKSKFQEENCGDTSPNWIKNPACHFLDGGKERGLHGGSVTIAGVVSYVNEFTDRPVLDQTGLTGYFNIETEGWASTTDANSDRPTLFDVFSKLGLRMDSQKAVIDMYVIDHVEKPSAN